MESNYHVGTKFRKEMTVGMRELKRFLKDEGGQDLVETILIILIMALVVMAVFPAVGRALVTAGNKIVSIINQALGLTF